MEKWWDNAKDWVKVLICIVVSIVSIALIILTMIMPIVWSIKLHNPAFLLLWCIPAGIFVGVAGVALGLSNFIYLSITKDIVTSDSSLALATVSIASGVGCCLAVALSNRFSKGKTYVNVIMSDNLEAMQKFRDFLATHHITNVAADSYTLDWSKKSITITAYAETKAQSRLIDDYIANSSLKFKRVISRS